MGKTQFVTLTVREYALLARLEGQARALTRAPSIASIDAIRASIRQTIDTLAKYRRRPS